MARRDRTVDGLRALALAGILQVNIQSFAWGPGEPLGYFMVGSGVLDVVVHGLVGTLVASKFLALFAFLFGLGCALQMRALRRSGRSWSEGKAVYRRRLAFLLVLGVLHGVFLYYGDVLTLYALCGFLLLRYVDVRPRRLLQSVRRWWIAFVIFTVAGGLLAAAFGVTAGRDDPDFDPTLVPEAIQTTLAVFSAGSYGEQLPVRAGAYLELQVVVLLFAVPQVMALFTLGLLAGRLGWLTRPARHRALWRGARRVGLMALPLALLGAVLTTASVLTTPGDPNALGATLTTLSLPLAALYAAVAVRRLPALPRFSAWLARAGRMPLSNYLGQSVLMGVLLSGWGLGWGASLHHAELAALGGAIVLLQWTVSAWWVGRFGQGPVEALWRYATYGARRARVAP